MEQEKEESMERSFLAAVSGIDANQTWLDVIGNNIANDNTTAFKEDSVVFDDLLAQQIGPASAPTVGQAGVNSIAVGSGTRVGAVLANFAEGTLLQTGNPNDVAIQGNGFLIGVQNGQTFYTRDGNLTVDANGDLATPTGALVQGWQAVNGVVNTNAVPGNLRIPIGALIPAQQTQNMTIGGNLNANDPVGTTVTMTTTVYDELGDADPVTLIFTKTATDTWSMQGTITTSANFSNTTKNLFTAAQTVTFNPNGTIATVNGATVPANTPYADPANNVGTADGFPNPLNLVFPGSGQPGAITQFATSDTASFTSQDGFAPGQLASFSISANGTITGQYTNGLSQAIGQIALALFTNPDGLVKVGNNLYQATPNSGQPVVGVAGTGGRGTLVGGALEASNVDLGQQLTDLVIAQTSYQANTRVIAASSAALQSLVTMP
jgi:flagellar hook protein FlgE